MHRRLFEAAQRANLVTAVDVETMSQMVERRNGDLDFAAKLLKKFHGVPDDRIAALREEISGGGDESDAPARSSQSGRVAPARGIGAGTDRDAALVVFPPQGDPTKEQLQVYGRATKTELYEARLRLREPLPRIVKLGRFDAIDAIAGDLNGNGFKALCLDAGAILGSMDRDSVRGVRDTGGGALAVEVRSIRGDTIERIDGETPLDLARAFLVVGRYMFSAKGQASLNTLGAGGSIQSARGEAHDACAFGHLYTGDSDVPFEFTETDLTNYEFLGPDKTYSARTNLRKLFDLLARNPGVTRTDVLWQHSGRVKNSMTGLASGGSGGFSYLVSETSSEGMCTTLSRILYHDWRAKG